MAISKIKGGISRGAEHSVSVGLHHHEGTLVP